MRDMSSLHRAFEERNARRENLYQSVDKIRSTWLGENERTALPLTTSFQDKNPEVSKIYNLSSVFRGRLLLPLVSFSSLFIAKRLFGKMISSLPLSAKVKAGRQPSPALLSTITSTVTAAITARVLEEIPRLVNYLITRASKSSKKL